MQQTSIASRKERNAMRAIYCSLLVMLCASEFLADYMVSTVIRSIELLCLMTVLFYDYKLWRMGSLSMPKGGAKFALTVLFILNIGIIARGDWDLTWHYLFLKLLSKQGFLAYILPFVIVPLPNTRHLDLIKGVFFVGALLAIPLWIMNADLLVQDGFAGEGVGSYLPFFAALLLGFPFVKKSRRKVCFLIWGVYIVLMLLNARRNMVFSLACYGTIAYYCCNFSRFAQNRARSVFIALFASVMAFLFVASNITYLSDTVFNRFSKRMNEDSRSGVEELFLADFATSPTEDWIFGRGIDGGYYQEMRDEDTGEVDTNRLGIETGYLNNVLKGGVFYAAFIVIVMLVCLIRSIKVKNIYSVYLRWVFLLFFIDLYATVLMGAFSVKSIIFWFCVSIALSREYRYLGQTGQTVCLNEK